MIKPTLVVMAAGIGSRYGGLKQIDPIGPNGEIIIDYSIYDALRAGFTSVVFIVRDEIRKQFSAHIGEKLRDRCDVSYVVQRLDDLPSGYSIPEGRNKPWGTAHAIFSCREVIDGPFAVINADDFYGRGAYSLLHDYLLHASDKDDLYNYCMVSYHLGNTLTEHGHVARGVCIVGDDECLVEIHERKRIELFKGTPRFTEDGENWVSVSSNSPVSMNMWGVTKSLLSELEPRFRRFLDTMSDPNKDEYLLPEVIGELITERRARIKVLPTQEQWFGVTYREDRPRVQEQVRALIEKGTYPRDLWKESPLDRS
ncbi:MAG TPA: nucleotidyltransferase [Candidatus Acetothermia bacterium]|nr:nucleotidyltransferase [Candidatus Acetothermia bacterium]